MDIQQLSIRQKQIFQILLNSSDYIPCKDIAVKLNVSMRTIKSDIKILKDMVKDPSLRCTFESMPSKGYKITCQNISQLQLSDDYFFSSNKYLEDDIRQVKLFLDILNSHKILTVNELTHRYYISRTTLYKDLENIERDLKKYNIQLVYTPYKGISVEGTEIDIRCALQNKLLLNASFLSEEFYHYFGYSYFTKKNLLEFINSFSMNKISDFELSNLYQHLLVILMRCQSEQYIDLQQLNYNQFVNELDIQKVSEYFYKNKPVTLTIPRDEIIYFILLIKGCNLGFCNQFALDLTVNSLNKLSELLKIDFNDSIRIANLSKYIYSMLIRSYNHFAQNSVLLDEIRDKHILSFDISYRYVTILEDMLNIKIDKREVAYLSYYFLDIRESLKKYYKPNKILLVSFRGATMCKHLLAELTSNFSFHSFEVCELYEVEEKVNQHHYSFIISDVSIHLNKDIPIILVSHFLDSNDYKLIRKHLRIVLNDLVEDCFLHQKIFSLEDKNAFLKMISSSLDEFVTLRDRERQFTYQIGHAAIVFVYNDSFQTSIYYSQNGIYWDNQLIHYVFVINITEYNGFLTYSKIINIFLKKVDER